MFNLRLFRLSRAAVWPMRWPLALVLLLGVVTPVGNVDAQTGTMTPIHVIQGAGDTSPLVGETVTIEGVVIGDYQGAGALGGFFVQEEASDEDGDVATSEGILVRQGATAVNEGDRVRVTGTVSEAAGLTQLNDVTSVVIVALDALDTVALAPVDLPVPAELTRDAFWEQREGMLVSFVAPMTVAEYFELGRYGRIVLSEGGRPYQFTQVNPPDADFAAWQDSLERRTIFLDDFNNQQNRADVVYHPQPDGLSPTHFFRGGDTVDGLIGVVNYGYDEWKIEPQTSRHVTFIPTNRRPNPPNPRGGVQVASFNVLNYFNGDGMGGGFPTSRGADSPAEFAIQRDKIATAITMLDADVVGLLEIENDDGPAQATADLVDALNAASDDPADHFAYVDTGIIGTDEIKVALIYRPAVVTPVGEVAVLDSSIDPDFDSQSNRPAVAQTFADNASGALITVVVNHLKSKGSGCGAGDDDPVQGNCTGTRTRAADALARWLASDPTGSGDPDVLIIGDLNSYAMEDPITALLDAGFVNLLDPLAYGYVFDGQIGTLDYALASSSLAAQVTGADVWHINADEIALLDYNDTVLDPGEEAYEAKPYRLTAEGPWRSSDHDPVIVGFDLTE